MQAFSKLYKLTTPEYIKAFRLALIRKDKEALGTMSSLTFIDDVLETGLRDIQETALRDTKQLLIGMVYALQRLDEDMLKNLKGLALATHDKLESLAWKTYVQLMRRAYRVGSELRKKHLRVE
jgi:hypothetical protein